MMKEFLMDVASGVDNADPSGDSLSNSMTLANIKDVYQ